MSVKNEILDRCDFSAEMRRYLKQQDLTDETLTEIITGSLLNFDEKLELYALLENKKARTLYKETKHALEEATLKNGEILTFHECWYDHDIVTEQKRFFTRPFTSYEAALKYLRKEILEEEWEDTSECWTELRKWVPSPDGTMALTYIYYFVKDEPVYFERLLYPPHHQNQGCFDSRFLDLPIPFKVGDIVSLNSLPFVPIRKAVLIEVKNNDCCGVQVLYRHDDGLWRTGALKHGAGWHWNYPMLSSLYRLEKNETDDSKEDEILSMIRNYIDGDLDKGKKLWEIMNHYEKWKEKGLTEAFIKSQLESKDITDNELKKRMNELMKEQEEVEE